MPERSSVAPPIQIALRATEGLDTAGVLDFEPTGATTYLTDREYRALAATPGRIGTTTVVRIATSSGHYIDLDLQASTPFVKVLQQAIATGRGVEVLAEMLNADAQD